MPGFALSLDLIHASLVLRDGPSAGIAMICAFVSLLTGAIIPPNIAMTGEVTLRGTVAPVGGIKEKVILFPRPIV